MSNNRRKYFNKVPPFTPDPEHWTRKGHSWKAKVGYDEEDQAWEYLRTNPRLMAQGYHVYSCKVCQKWHIGKWHERNKRKKK